MHHFLVKIHVGKHVEKHRRFQKWNDLRPVESVSRGAWLRQVEWRSGATT
jgi:hypothetical protein